MRITFALIFLALSGCGAAAEDEAEVTEETVTTGDEAIEEAVPSPPVAWDEMDHEAQARWMMAEVVPRMGERFQAFDAERYADFGCPTCHGPNPRENGFDMPSAALPALPATGTPEQHQMVRDYPEMVRFMFNDVLPTMQTLVGGADFDEETGEGFSCYSCHPHAGDEGTTLIELSAPEGDAGAE
ncbi:MAG: hypothetical protein SangKO_077080 [Sandaracinaceae bacterium]